MEGDITEITERYYSPFYGKNRLLEIGPKLLIYFDLASRYLLADVSGCMYCQI